MSDRAQQTILQELERLLPHIRRLEVENKATADEKAASSEEAIGEQLAKVIARDAALQRETEQQRVARERVTAADAAPIIEAIRPPPQAAPQAAEQEPSVLDRLGALPDLKKATLVAAGFQDPDAVLLAAAKGLGSKTSDAKYARVVVAKRLAVRRAESLAAADLAAALPERPLRGGVQDPDRDAHARRRLWGQAREDPAPCLLPRPPRPPGAHPRGDTRREPPARRWDRAPRHKRRPDARPARGADNRRGADDRGRAAGSSDLKRPPPPSYHRNEHHNDPLVVEFPGVRGAR